MENQIQETIMLRHSESAELISSVKDSRTQKLLSAASYCVIKKFLENKTLPVANFDLRFFSEAMLEFCSNHELIQKILNGQEVGWFDDDEI
jgi:hypothetical protein